MFIDKWDKMPEKKRTGQENRLRKAARRFYKMKKKPPYLSTVFMYHINKFIIKKFVGEGAYPYEYWKEMGYFHRRPF